MSKRIGEYQWFYHLKANPENPDAPYLFEVYHPNTDSDLVISLERGETRLYAYFSSYLDFYREFITYMPKYRNFHEVILSNKKLKLYFDVDIDEVQNFDQIKFFDDTITHIITIFESLEIKLDLKTDIIWLTSHKEDKYSYHLIVDNHCFDSLNEIRFVIDKFRSLTNFPSYFDFGVYCKNKTLRTCHSTKIKENRIFRPLNKWHFRGEEIDYQYRSDDKNKMMLDIAASLITNTGHCKLVNFFLKTEKIKEIKHIEINNELDMIISGLIDKLGFAVYLRRERNRILLTRISEAECEICQRSHDSQNPFLEIREEAGKLRIYYNCRRNDKNLILYEQDIVRKDIVREDIELSGSFDDLKSMVVRPQKMKYKMITHNILDKIKLEL